MKRRKEHIPTSVITGVHRGVQYRIEDSKRNTVVFLYLNGEWRRMFDDTLRYYANPELFMSHLRNTINFMLYVPKSTNPVQASMFDEATQ
jgi:hypothetical protein